MGSADSKFRFVRVANVWSGDEGWKLLFYYNLYRFTLALVLVAIISPNFDYYTVGGKNPVLVFAIAGFVLVSVLALVSIKRQAPAVHIQAHALFLLDIVFIGVLTYSQQLHDGNIVIFCITTIAATAVMFQTRTALGYASLSSILELIAGDAALDQFYLTALIALGLFTTVLVVSQIAQNTRVVQSVLEKRAALKKPLHFWTL